MAVTAVTELFEDRAGESSVALAQTIRTYTRTFRVTTNDKNDDVYPVGTASGVPRHGDRYPSDSQAWCRSLSVRQLAGAMHWEVTCSYSSEFEITTNPLDDPAVITWSAEQFQRPTWKDRDGFPLLNSAGRFFEKLPMVDDSRFVVSVQKNVAIVPTWVATYQDALNISAFTVDGITVAAKLAKLNSLKIGNQQERNAIQFRVLSFDIHLSAIGWDLEILDEGKARRGNPAPATGEVGDSTESGDRMYAAVNDGDFSSSGESVLLDGTGKQLPANSLGYFMIYGYYPLKDFTVLPLT